MSDDTKREFGTAEDIISTDDLDIIEVEVPEWNTTLRLRVLSANDQKLFAQEAKDEVRKYEGIARAIVRSAVDAGGKTFIFDDSHVRALMKKNLRVLNRLQVVIWKHNGMDLMQKALSEAKND